MIENSFLNFLIDVISIGEFSVSRTVMIFKRNTWTDYLVVSLVNTVG